MSWKKACRRIESKSVGLFVVLVEMLVNLGNPGWAGWRAPRRCGGRLEIKGPGADSSTKLHRIHIAPPTTKKAAVSGYQRWARIRQLIGNLDRFLDRIQVVCRLRTIVSQFNRSIISMDCIYCEAFLLPARQGIDYGTNFSHQYK